MLCLKCKWQFKHAPLSKNICLSTLCNHCVEINIFAIRASWLIYLENYFKVSHHYWKGWLYFSDLNMSDVCFIRSSSSVSHVKNCPCNVLRAQFLPGCHKANARCTPHANPPDGGSALPRASGHPDSSLTTVVLDGHIHEWSPAFCVTWDKAGNGWKGDSPWTTSKPRFCRPWGGEQVLRTVTHWTEHLSTQRKVPEEHSINVIFLYCCCNDYCCYYS